MAMMIAPCAPEMNVLWVHNTVREGRMFLWDVLDAVPSAVTIRELLVPLRPGMRSVRSWIGRIKAAARSADIVHAQFGSLVGMMASFTATPYVLSLRGTDFYVLPAKSLFGRLESRLRQFFTFVACRRADVVVVMSQRMRRELWNWPTLRGKPVVVLVDPVGDEFIDADQLASFDRELEQLSRFVVFVGSLSADNPVKRTWLVEEAVALCQSIGLPIELKVVSGAPRNEVRSAMLESDVAVLASTHEGWPNVIKEGQLIGLPFIATDVSDLAGLCGAHSPNRIVEPHALDIAFAIVDSLAYKLSGSRFSHLFPKVVGLKHQILYTYCRKPEL